MADENDTDKPTEVQVFQSHRMADPNIPDDTVHGKRFTDAKGQPASIADLLESFGIKKKDAE